MYTLYVVLWAPHSTALTFRLFDFDIPRWVLRDNVSLFVWRFPTTILGCGCAVCWEFVRAFSFWSSTPAIFFLTLTSTGGSVCRLQPSDMKGCP
jgi:hypothetical protein